MTKEQFLEKWNVTSPFYKADLEAVIATEIAKAQEAKPEEPEQPAKPFDKERFEAMFRAVVASEAEIDFVFRRNETNYLLEQLDAYYASKNN